MSSRAREEPVLQHADVSHFGKVQRGASDKEGRLVNTTRVCKVAACSCCEEGGICVL